jgi:hypothetical protein
MPNIVISLASADFRVIVLCLVTSHVTRHTSHVTRCRCAVTVSLSFTNSWLDWATEWGGSW